MDVFALSASISLNLDNFNTNLDKAQKKFKSFSDNISGLSGKIDSVYKGVGDALKPAVDGFKAVEDVGKKAGNAITTGLKGFAAAATAVGGFGAAAAKSGMQFDATMSEVSAISGATGQDFQDLRDKALEMGAKTKFSASEAAEAMTYMGMAGWNARQMLSGMPGVLDLAAASGEDLAGVADIVTDSLTGFKMTAADTGEFVDVLATAASKSNTNVSMLGESFKYVAPLAGTLGYSAQDTAVMLGLMANSGIKASQAGTTLRTAITNLASPTKEQAAEMERLGISLTDTNGQMLPMLDMVGNLRGAFSGMSEAEQSAAASTIFGKEAMSGMLAIINASESDYQSLTQSIYKLYVLMSDGTLATEEIKAAVLAACSADTVRPLTDQVFVEDAEQVKYNIDFTYYTQTGSGRSAVEIQTAVDNAVREYIRWQDTKLGRDINPDELRERLYHTGIKRIELREPAFTKLQNDSLSVPQVGQAGEITVVNGGYEDE